MRGTVTEDEYLLHHQLILLVSQKARKDTNIIPNSQGGKTTYKNIPLCIIFKKSTKSTFFFSSLPFSFHTDTLYNITICKLWFTYRCYQNYLSWNDDFELLYSRHQNKIHKAYWSHKIHPLKMYLLGISPSDHN